MLTTAYATGTTTAIFPSPGVHATCIDCGKEVISKCGSINAHHFAHRPGVVCNTRFHDGKTEWHINWQHTIEPALPGINVEVPIKKDGSIKRADLISKSGYIIEFQHSHLPRDERIEREKHYKNIIWVVHTDRENSKTWNYPAYGVRTFFNGDDNIVRWNHFTITKEKFIALVINNKKYTDKTFQTIEERQNRDKYSGVSPYYGLYYTGWDAPTLWIWQLNIHPICLAFIFLNQEYHKLNLSEQNRQRYLELKKQEAKNQYQELLKTRDPAFLQLLIKSLDDFKSMKATEHYYSWTNRVARELENQNREIKHKRELRITEKFGHNKTKGYNLFVAWLYFNNVINPVTERDWAITVNYIDTTPIPTIPRSARKSILAKRKEINRGRR